MLRVAEKELLGRVIKRYGAAPSAKSGSAGAGEPSKRKRQPAAAGTKKKGPSKKGKPQKRPK
jgi:hypothetical protein